MKRNPFKNLWLVIVGAVIVPITLYGVYEISSLTDHEKQIQESYGRQLDAILFSVNQYTEDRVSSMATWIENNLNGELDSALAYDLQKSYPYLEQVWQMNPKAEKPTSLFIASDTLSEATHNETFKKLYEFIKEIPEEKFQRLIQYRKSGFRKIEALGKVPDTYRDLHSWAFVAMPDDNPQFTIIFFRTQELIDKLLIPKMEYTSREDFCLTIKGPESEEPIFSHGAYPGYDLQNRNLWLLPDHTVGISLPVRTLSEMVNDRIARNLFALGLLLAVLLMGIFILYRSTKREMEFAQAKAEFVSNVSHEIRTPLALISMFAETLSLGRVPSEERKKEYYEIICKETARLTNIVNRILSFSKMEAGKKEFKLENQDLNQVVAEVVNSYSYHLESNSFQYTAEYASETLPISADHDAITEAFVNLIDNAMKYSPDQKEINISTRKQGNFAILEISDKGIGMTQQQAKHIFDKFYRAPQGNIHNTKGAGLGLSIVKQIIDAHHGEISVTSVPEKGSTFRVKFPILN